MNRTVISGYRPIINRLSQWCQQWCVKKFYIRFKISFLLLYSKTRHEKISVKDDRRNLYEKVLHTRTSQVKYRVADHTYAVVRVFIKYCRSGRRTGVTKSETGDLYL